MKLPIKFTLPLMIILLLVSCGKGEQMNGSHLSSEIETIEPDGSNINGIYAATLMPLNFSLSLNKVGSVAIERSGDELKAYVHFKNGGKSAWHIQNIYNGNRCPGVKEDLNKDAYIDLAESRDVIGKILIPLDADLDSQVGGKYNYPVSDSTGTYDYENSASFLRMFEDLKTPDENEDDDFMRLGQDQGFSLIGKVVIVHGTSLNTTLPSTISGHGGLSGYQGIPIACGVLWKVSALPEDLGQGRNSGTSYRPIAEIEPMPVPTPGPVVISDPNGPSRPTTRSRPRRRWYERVGDWIRDRVEEIGGNS